MRVAIGIITCRRPKGLARLLDGLARLKLSPAYHARVEIIVVDNDPAGSSHELVEEYAQRFRWPIHWSCERRRGIPFARNRVVQTASDVEFLAFIDDDEVPEPRWLDELLKVQRRFNADVVAGPVLSTFETPPPDWIVQGRFFDRPRRPTGSAITTAGTGNILFRRSVLDAVDGPFDERLANTGGSDAFLLRALQARRTVMVWADEAIAVEEVPATRATSGWLLRRAFRTGSMRGHTEYRHGASRAETLRVVACGEYKLVTGLLAAPLLSVLGRHRLMEALRRFAYGAGMISGVLGYHYHEYRHLHGS